jgi:hypothetical protein
MALDIPVSNRCKSNDNLRGEERGGRELKSSWVQRKGQFGCLKVFSLSLLLCRQQQFSYLAT